MLRKPLVLLTLLLALVLPCVAPLRAQSVPEYSCLTKHIDLEKWLQQYQRTFDSTGIILQAKEYNPLTIAAFGIMSYHRYLETGDKKYYTYTVNQYAYFCDPKKVVLSDSGRCLGLPNRKPYMDMDPPWYSGMTQGMGISYLLRYYLLTKDEKALVKAQQLARLMLKPQEQGGTIGKTNEGYAWIEEYPRSRMQPHVLNGSINGLIGLYEYCRFFPADTTAKRIHDACYQSLLETLGAYDTPNWTDYNRKGFACTNHYIHYEMDELAHLRELYTDPRLELQLMIWAKFAYNKFEEKIEFYSQPKFQYALPMEMQPDSSWHAPELVLSAALHQPPGLAHGSHSGKHQLPLELSRKRATRLSWNEPTYFLQLGFDSIPAGAMLTFEARSSKGIPVQIAFSKTGRTCRISSGEAFSSITISLDSPGKEKVRLQSIETPDPAGNWFPRYFYCSLPQTILLEKGQSYRILLEGRNLKRPVIFYRSGRSADNLVLVKWTTGHTITDTEALFTAPETGTYGFFITFPANASGTEISRFELQPAR